jgi:uncharacterized coiled-coil protein SlyX
MPREEPDLLARVIELETRILFLEQELSKLSGVLAEEAERAERLEGELARLAGRLQAACDPELDLD